MKRFLSLMMALSAVLIFAGCSSDEPTVPPRRTLEGAVFTSQAEGINVNGGPLGQLSSTQDARLHFTSATAFSFTNVIDVTADLTRLGMPGQIPFKITVKFDGKYTTGADGAISLQARGESLSVDPKFTLPPNLAAMSEAIRGGIASALGLTKDKLNATAIPAVLDRAKAEIKLAYPKDWNTPMTNTFVWTTPAQ